MPIIISVKAIIKNKHKTAFWAYKKEKRQIIKKISGLLEDKYIH